MASNIYFNSVGIDIGTTTTQVIFSRLYIANTLPEHLAPRLEIVKREILHRGDIHFTPLLNPETIDALGVGTIIEKEFRLAGLNKEEVHSGAVIITGQSVKKNNAEEIAHALADISGNFVVVTAGPHIESILAGKGAGAAARSAEKGNVTVNIDIGGGTSNIAVFKNGLLIDSCCLNIGGRLLQISTTGIVSAVAEELKPLIDGLGINLNPGTKVNKQQLQLLTNMMAIIIRYALLQPGKEILKQFLVTEGLKLKYKIDEVMFSGGVADYIYLKGQPRSISEITKYGDIGPMLGTAVKNTFVTEPVTLCRPAETIRATVIGAGIQSLRLSGGTILVNQSLLPLKNIPVLKISDLSTREPVIDAINTLIAETEPVAIALALGKIMSLSFADINDIALQITEIISATQRGHIPVVIITENDCAMALGQVIGNLTGDNKIMCIDQIPVDDGDYIDIGRPIDNKAVPVVVKTLLFN